MYACKNVSVYQTITTTTLTTTFSSSAKVKIFGRENENHGVLPKKFMGSIENANILVCVRTHARV